MKELLKRCEENPLISVEDFPIPAYAVFNCGQTMFEGKVLLLLSVIYKERRPSAIPAGTITGIHVATSEDGIHFDINPEPLFDGTVWTENVEKCDCWIIDPRVTKIGDTYYISRPGHCADGPSAILFKTKDFKTTEFIDCIALPSNRVPCLFPEKINGMYMKIDRPYNHVSEQSVWDGQPSIHQAGMWISESPDLVHWGHYRPILRPEMPFANYKIGPTPPVRTKDGWLAVIHGVIKIGQPYTYYLGAMLLDLDDPTKVIGYTHTPILAPTTEYELKGRAVDTVFSCGFIADEEKDEIKVYYGAADERIGLATGKLSEVIDACKNNR